MTTYSIVVHNLKAQKQPFVVHWTQFLLLLLQNKVGRISMKNHRTRRLKIWVNFFESGALAKQRRLGILPQVRIKRETIIKFTLELDLDPEMNCLEERRFALLLLPAFSVSFFTFKRWNLKYCLRYLDSSTSTSTTTHAFKQKYNEAMLKLFGNRESFNL